MSDATTPARARMESRPVLETVRVLRAVTVTPRLRRITVGGPGLRPFAEVYRPGDAIKLFLPDPPGPLAVVPVRGEDGRLRPPPGQRPPNPRAYTFRRFDPDALEADLDVVIHGDGPGSAWSLVVRTGDEIAVIGPRHDHWPDETVRTWVMAGDETALPAIAAITESLPPHVRVHAYVEVRDREDHQRLAPRAELTLTYLDRGDATPGTGTLLLDALRAHPWPRTPDGSLRVWVACESDVLRPIRRFLRVERGLTKAQVHLAGYWRRGTDVDTMGARNAAETARLVGAGVPIADSHDYDEFEPEVDAPGLAGG